MSICRRCGDLDLFGDCDCTSYAYRIKGYTDDDGDHIWARDTERAAIHAARRYDEDGGDYPIASERENDFCVSVQDNGGRWIEYQITGWFAPTYIATEKRSQS